MALLFVDGNGLRHGPIRFPDGSPPPPHGCRWCGRPTWMHGMGEEWTRPTPAQTIARMQARRKARAETRRLARVLTSFDLGSLFVGPCERRRRRRAELAQTPPPAPPRPVVCDEMNHDGRGHETFCQEDRDDGHETHDDGHGTTWDREDGRDAHQ